MQIYLPIAGMTVEVLTLLSLGGMVGFLSGLFGVGGGFLMTPLLIFLGIPPAIAVGTQANQLVAASVSGALAHWKRRAVDVRMGLVMLSGSLLGTFLGVGIFGLLSRLGQIDLVISLAYVLLLGGIGAMMLWESTRSLALGRAGRPGRRQRAAGMMRQLPFPMRFPASRLYISALVPASVGFAGGLLVGIMGIGGGFILVPAMIYLIGMPVALVAGTSLFQIIFTTAVATFLQAVTNQTVDIVLALLLVLGGVVGAQIGTMAGVRLKPEYGRALLALIVLVLAGLLAHELVATPDELFSVRVMAP